MAEVATMAVTGLEAQPSAMSLPPARPLAEVLDDLSDQRAVVHQAAGMVAAQLEVALEEALVMLRARAYTQGRPVSDVAHEVVERRLRFD